MNRVSLAGFDNSWYKPGRTRLVRMLWFFVGLPLLRSSWNPSSAFRAGLLRIFGACIGQGVVIKPGVRVKYPWLLSVGNNSWLGEDVWLDNLERIEIGADVCVSQKAYLCTGNHDWTNESFALMVKPIVLRDCCWVGAGVLVGPGVTLAEGAVAAAGSVVYKDLEAWTIYSGNPAAMVKRRVIRPSAGPPS
jgi:putative colanic acid biosynthesis acetyltransferase WcaF